MCVYVPKMLNCELCILQCLHLLRCCIEVARLRAMMQAVDVAMAPFHRGEQRQLLAKAAGFKMKVLCDG